MLFTVMKARQSLPVLAATLIWFTFASEISCRAQFLFSANSDGGYTLIGYSGASVPIVIPATYNGLPVTRIGSSAFDYRGVPNITVPDSVRSILDFAFAHDGSLTNVSLGAGVTNIDGTWLKGSYGLLSIDVSPQNPAFSSAAGILFNKDATRLVKCPAAQSGSYTVPTTVTVIGAGAFDACHQLSDILLPHGLLSISTEAFQFCALFTNITIPDTVTNIGDYAYYGLNKIPSLTLPDSVQTLGYQTFGYCSALTNVLVGKGQKSLGSFPFYGCMILQCIDVDPSNKALSSVDGVVFDYDRKTIVAYPNARGGTYRIPDGVTTIVSWAFGNSSLSSVTMPSSLVLVQAAAFYASYGLTSVYFLGNAPRVTSNGQSTFSSATLYYLPGTVGWGATLDHRPTAAWVLPQPLILGRSVCVTNGSFGFIMSWASNATVAVDACADINSPVWTQLDSRALTNGFSYFGDSYRTNDSSRFYRLRSP
jgi:hypothetical protein